MSTSDSASPTTNSFIGTSSQRTFSSSVAATAAAILLQKQPRSATLAWLRRQRTPRPRPRCVGLDPSSRRKHSTSGRGLQHLWRRSLVDAPGSSTSKLFMSCSGNCTLHSNVMTKMVDSTYRAFNSVRAAWILIRSCGARWRASLLNFITCSIARRRTGSDIVHQICRPILPIYASVLFDVSPF